MKLSLPSLLFVFLADKLNPPCATPSSLRCCTWSIATCTLRRGPEYHASATQWYQPGIQPRSIQVRGCLDYFSIVCIRVTVGSQDLKAVSLKEPINLLAKPSKGDSQPRQWPIVRQMYQFTQLFLSINQLDTRRILAGAPLEYRVVSMSYSPADRSRNASYAVSNLSWSEATDEASKMVHSESVEELSDTPDQPLSAPDPLSAPPSMTTSAPLCLAVALRSAGIRLGVSVNLFSSNCLI